MKAALSYTAIETCQRNGVEPPAYIADVIEKIASGWPAARWGELMPWNWRPDFQAIAKAAEAKSQFAQLRTCSGYETIAVMRGLFLATLFVAGCSPRATFDQSKWQSAELTGRARAEMLPDFLVRHPLKGMPRERVIALLGQPTTTDKWRGADLIYVLGNDGSTYGAIDNEWLLITLDHRGRVTSFERVKD